MVIFTKHYVGSLGSLFNQTVFNGTMHACTMLCENMVQQRGIVSTRSSEFKEDVITTTQQAVYCLFLSFF